MFNPNQLFRKIFKNSNQRELEKLKKIVDKINNYEPSVQKLTDDFFPKKTSVL